MQLRWSAEAASDLERITNYLFEETPQHAPELVRAIYKAPSALLTFPHRGRPGKKQNTRELVLSPEWSNNSDDCVGGGCPPRSHSPGEWNRCKQRPTETQVSNITHCGIGHFQAPNIARDTFLAVTHVPHLFAA
jgi:hypothetical protein